MSVPMPASQPSPADELPAVRLDVRTGNGKLTSFTVDQQPFRIGGAAECDLILSGSHLPPMVGTIQRTPSGVSFQRTDPAFPVLLNGQLIGANGGYPLKHGDRLAIGSTDATVVVGSHHLRPSFISVDAIPEPVTTAPVVEVDPWAELERQRAELTEQARELEADRVLWYKRRREVEAECVQLREAAQRQTAAISPEQQDLDKVRQELATIRQQLFDEYQRRKEELVQMQSVVRGASDSLKQREEQFEAQSRERAQRLQASEADLQERIQAAVAQRLERLELDFAERQRLAEQEFDERRQQLETEYALRIPPAVAVKLQDREAELQRLEEQHKSDLLRLERWEARLEDQERDQRQQAELIDQRHQQLHRDSLEWEEQLRLAQAEQARLISDAARLQQQRQDAERLAEQLAERAAQLDAQQASLAVVRARLDRQQHEANQEAARLQADRERLDTAQQELDSKLLEAEKLRTELVHLQAGAEEQSRVVAERNGLLEATLAELEQQNTALRERETRLNERESALDARSVEMAEQTAILTARVTQVMELQQRLEADRGLLHHRELTINEADTARQTFQDQLRRRADELSARSRQLDELTQQLHSERADLERLRAEWESTQSEREAEHTSRTTELAERSQQLERQTRELADREANLARQIARLQDVGRQVAASRRELQELKRGLTEEQTHQQEQLQSYQRQLAELRSQLQPLREESLQVLEQLQAGRERLRSHLTEVHRFANSTREELEAQRASLRAEAEQLRERERLLDEARAEHRLALTEYRQQLHDWQTKLAEVRTTVNRSETQLASKHAEVSAAAQLAEQAALEIAQQKEEIRQEKLRVSERRAEVERHLAEMREWYRRKLRDLAKARSAVEPVSTVPFRAEELDPGDRQLGELLLKLDLVDSESLAALWQQAQSQRRTLRHVLLVSGVVTLYQLALIEAGNLDALMLGRFRVIDRVSHSPAETIYRVYDPSRSTQPSRGVYLLRWLSEAELEDPIHPDEYIQRFTALSQIQHQHLHQTLEVLTIQQRPAVLQEWLFGLPSADWPTEVATPGVWLRLLREVASALECTHNMDFPHGRLTTSAVLLTLDQGVKLLGAGEPHWLHGEADEPTASLEQDLRALGQLAYLWLSQGQQSAKKRPRGKGFPDSLQAVLRRLEADRETPMGDTVAGTMPYRSTSELVEDLTRLGQVFPCPDDAWGSLLRQVAENVESPTMPLRRSA